MEQSFNVQRMQMCCDNQAAIKKIQETQWTPSSMIQPEADIILATRSLVAAADRDHSFHHVYGHQDTRNPTDQDCTTPTSLSTASSKEDECDIPTHEALTPQAILNVECDRLAEATALAVIERGDMGSILYSHLTLRRRHSCEYSTFEWFFPLSNFKATRSPNGAVYCFAPGSAIALKSLLPMHQHCIGRSGAIHRPVWASRGFEI